MEDPAATEAALRRLTAASEEIAAIPVRRNAYRKQFYDLARRIKVLAPMFEEMSESTAPLSAAVARAVAPFAAALESARELLRFINKGSKIFLVLDKDGMMKRFQGVSAQFEEALAQISYDDVDISQDLKEQVVLVHSQFRRAKEWVDIPDDDLYSELSMTCNENTDASIDDTILKRLAEKLQLMTLPDITEELFALHQLAASGCDELGKEIGKMLLLLERIKKSTPELLTAASPDTPSVHFKKEEEEDTPLVDQGPPAPEFPKDLLCPICMDPMTDPVIVCTGQTYDRDCIEEWIEKGERKCPNSGQILTNTTLTTNFIVISLLSWWCKVYGMVPEEDSASLPSRPPLPCLAGDHSKVVDFIFELSSPNLERRRSAAGGLRLLARESAENLQCIAEAGAIPHLVSLLSATDPGTQEHAVGALLNLSIREENIRIIVESNAVGKLVGILETAPRRIGEYLAAMLVFLSVDDLAKVSIGRSGAIKALARVLREGSQRGKKDAAQALFLLCIHKGNRAKAVSAGMVPILMELLRELEESVAILQMLSYVVVGRMAIRKRDNAVPALVEMIRSGTSGNGENAMGVLYNIFRYGKEEVVFPLMAIAANCQIMVLIDERIENGTARGRRKAEELQDVMNQYHTILLLRNRQSSTTS